MAKDIKFNIKLSIDGKDHLVTATTNSKKLASELGKIGYKADEAAGKFVKFGNISNIAKNAEQSLGQIFNVLSDLSGAYQEQIMAETKLQTIMRQRMSATEADIQGIKELCSAQQELGVIGDEVQLAGAQQIATFLDEKSSLEKLIPAMNDLVAQQKGLNATGQDAVTVGNLIGKVMQGQTSALTRVGITFDEAQEKVLKYGTESERAAMLADVITQNVGHMNAELAKTDSGRMKQLSNTLGDYKEKLGEVAKTVMPYVTWAQQSVVLINGTVQLVASMKVLGAMMSLSALKASSLSAATMLCGVSMSRSAAFARVMSAALTTGAYSATALKLALRGLMIATGVGAAITVLYMAVEKFVNASSDATTETNHLKDGEQEMVRVSGEAKAAMDGEARNLQTLIKAKQDTTAAVADLNTKYGGIFGSHKTAAEWYDILTKKSKDYAMQLGYEAQAKLYASKVAENQVKIDLINQKIQESYKNGSGTKKVMQADTSVLTENIWAQHSGGEKIVDSDFMKQLKAQLATAKNDMQEANAAMLAAQAHIKPISYTPATTKSTGGGKATATTKSIPKQVAPKEETEQAIGIMGKLEAEIQAINKAIRDSEDAGFSELLVNQLHDAEKALADYRKSIGLDKEDSNPSIDEPKEDKPVFNAAARTLGGINTNIEILRGQLNDATADTAAGINEQIRYWEGLADAIQGAGQAGEKSFDKMRRGWNSVKGVKGGVDSMSDALSGNKDAWSSIAGVVDGALEVYDGIMGVVSVVNALTMADKASAAATTAKGAATAIVGTTSATAAAAEVASAEATLPIIATNSAITKSYMELAAAEYMAAHAYIPFAGVGIATGFTEAANAVVLAQKAVPFADGGIVSGPTLALMGEYAGASNNPEVIAPLDKLRSLIGSRGGDAVNIRLSLKGRELVGLMENETRSSGRKTRFKL